MGLLEYNPIEECKKRQEFIQLFHEYLLWSKDMVS